MQLAGKGKREKGNQFPAAEEKHERGDFCHGGHEFAGISGHFNMNERTASRDTGRKKS